MNVYSEYTVKRKEISAFPMLKLVLKNWFFVFQLFNAMGCVLFLFIGFFLIFWALQQVLLFPLFLPVQIFIFWPLSVFLYKNKERDWLYWMVMFGLSVLCVCSIIGILFGFEAIAPFFLMLFLQSMGVGIFMYKSLYNVDTIDLVPQSKES